MLQLNALNSLTARKMHTYERFRKELNLYSEEEAKLLKDLLEALSPKYQKFFNETLILPLLISTGAANGKMYLDDQDIFKNVRQMRYAFRKLAEMSNDNIVVSFGQGDESVLYYTLVIVRVY